jgi:hypothetical protein
MDQTTQSKRKSPRVSRAELFIWLLIAAAIWPIHTAYAYVDPGTGSFIVQILIGMFFGAAYAVRRFWSTITGWFKKKPTQGAAPTTEEKKTDGK